MSIVVIATDVFYLVVYLHCFACFFFYFIKEDKIWYPLEDGTDDSWYDFSWYNKYALCMYYSTVNLFGSDMYPHDNLITIISIFGGLFGILIFAKLTGDIVVS